MKGKKDRKEDIISALKEQESDRRRLKAGDHPSISMGKTRGGIYCKPAAGASGSLSFYKEGQAGPWGCQRKCTEPVDMFRSSLNGT